MIVRHAAPAQPQPQRIPHPGQHLPDIYVPGRSPRPSKYAFRLRIENSPTLVSEGVWTADTKAEVVMETFLADGVAEVVG